MVDDPLSFLGVVVWLMAAGMYPVGVGYMFGVCSACCDDCPEECSKCTHWHNTGGLCNLDPETSDWISTRTWSYTVAGIGTVTVTNAPGEPCTGQGDNSLDIPFESLPQPEGTNWFAAYFCSADFDGPLALDECGCNSCAIEISLTVRLRVEGDGEDKEYRRPFVGTLNECSQTSLSMFPSSDWLAIIGYPGDFGEQVLEFLNGLDITMSLSDFEPCDCGACCDDGCEENVAEGGCDSWQGVGVGCDPDPCE